MTISYISSKATGTIVTKFQVKPPGAVGTKNCLNRSCHMTILKNLLGLFGCFGHNGPLRQYFSLYRTVSQREGERREKMEKS